jgi:ATPase family associated with various cellular activities (AAA)
MSEDNQAPSWEDRNNAYLAAELHGLRERLRSRARVAFSRGEPAQPAELPEEPVLTPVAEPERRRLWRRRKSSTPEVAAPDRTTSAVDGHQDVLSAELPLTIPFEDLGGVEDLDDLAASAARDDQPPALVELADRVGLTPFERDVLLLATATELDPQAAELCAAAQGYDGRPTPNFGLALRLFEDPEWEALAPHRPLRRLQLVTLVGGSDSVVHAGLRADERVVNLLKGLDHLDERLVELLIPMAAGQPDQPIARSHAGTIERILRRAQASAGDRVVVSLAGSHPASKRIIAQAVVAEIGAFVVRLPVTNLPPPGPDLASLIRLWERDSLLSPLALYLDAFDPEGDLPREATLAARRLLSRAKGLIFIDSREAWSGLDGTAFVVDVANPTPAEQQEAWETTLPDPQTPLARDLAAHFDLDPLTIRDLAGNRSADTGLGKALWDEVRMLRRPNLDLLGRRAQATVGPNELILPDDVLAQLERIKEQVRQRARVYNDWGLASRMSRGLGISALFAGESGTGKTLAAEVIAAELDLDLYRIDLSGVVSKYIGETEKNLRRVFDAAEQGGTILCFDEADALFGKRSEVKDSHDRYANIEVNYLLQRMEEYRGLAILTTNMKTALDQAFTRRIRFVVDFPFPGPDDRERMWRGAFVPSLNTEQLDFEWLAQLKLAGGGIHNVAVNATFAAAASPDQALTMRMVLDAARLEYRKNDLPVNEASFAWDERTTRAHLSTKPAPVTLTA